MKKLQRYDIEVASWGSSVEDIKNDSGDYVLSEDVAELEEKVVRLTAERDEAAAWAQIVGCDQDMIRKAGDEAFEDWKAENA